MEYLGTLFKASVKAHVTQRECDMGLEWLFNMCKNEPRLAEALFQDVFLKHASTPEGREMFCRSDR